MSVSDTIFALSSAPGISGVAVVRVSGSRIGEVIRSLRLGSLVPRRAKLTRLIDPASGELIDSGLALLFPAS